MLKFAAIGIDHAHIFDHVNGLLAAGCEFVGYCPETSVPSLMADFVAKYPNAAARNRDELFDAPDIDIICTAAIPKDRAVIGMRAMRAGKDVMADKPGIVSYDQYDAMEKCLAETGKFYSVCFSERLCVRSAIKAGHLVKAGAIGQVIQTIGTGPHRKSLNVRPDWFFDMAQVGGIITDIASHQIDQFLYYTDATGAEVVASSVGNFDTPHPGFEDFGEVLLRSRDASGYIRVDWFTPDGLKSWGDGRLIILGTKGYIELRKYIDIAGRPGGNHLFLIDGAETRHIDCSDVKLEYFDQFVADVQNRTETAMSQAHVMEVCKLSLDAQARAARLGGLA